MLKQIWEEVASKHGNVDLKALITDLYHTQGLTMQLVGLRLGVSQRALADKMKELGIQSKSRYAYNHPWRRRKKE